MDTLTSRTLNRSQPEYDDSTAISLFDRFVEQVLKENFRLADGTRSVSFKIYPLGNPDSAYSFTLPAGYFSQRDTDVRQYIPEFTLHNQEMVMGVWKQVVVECASRSGSEVDNKKIIITNGWADNAPDYLGTQKDPTGFPLEGLRLRESLLDTEGIRKGSIKALNEKVPGSQINRTIGYKLLEDTSIENNNSDVFNVIGPSNFCWKFMFDHQIEYKSLAKRNKIELCLTDFAFDVTPSEIITRNENPTVSENPTNMAIGWKVTDVDSGMSQFFYGIPQEAKFGNVPFSSEAIRDMMIWLMITESYLLNDDYHDAMSQHTNKEAYNEISKYLRKCKNNTYLLEFPIKKAGSHYVLYGAASPLSYVDDTSVTGSIIYGMDADLYKLKYKDIIWSQGSYTKENVGCHVLALAVMYANNMITGACPQNVTSMTSFWRGLDNLLAVCEGATVQLYSGLKDKTLGKKMCGDFVIQEDSVAFDDMIPGCNYILWRYTLDGQGNVARTHFMVLHKEEARSVIIYDSMHPSQGTTVWTKSPEFHWQTRIVRTWSGKAVEEEGKIKILLSKYDNADSSTIVDMSTITPGLGVDITKDGSILS